MSQTCNHLSRYKHFVSYYVQISKKLRMQTPFSALKNCQTYSIVFKIVNNCMWVLFFYVCFSFLFLNERLQSRRMHTAVMKTNLKIFLTVSRKLAIKETFLKRRRKTKIRTMLKKIKRRHHIRPKRRPLPV